MSIVPMMFRDWWDDWERPSRLLDQHFGMGLRRDDLLSSLSAVPTSSLFRNSYFRPWRTSLARQESSSTINLTKDKFERDEWDGPSRLLDQHYSFGHLRDALSPLSAMPTSSLFRNSYFRPWRTSLERQESSSTVNLTKDKFKVILDVQQFSPEEITVKASNNSVIVEGKHEEKQDEHGYISRQFIRRYILPTGYELTDLVSTLSSDGVLTITAPKRPPVQAGERIVPITKTGPAKQPEPVREHPREQTVPIVTSP